MSQVPGAAGSPKDDVWTQRSKSFGSVAEDYDRYRPGYPDELFDLLLALSPGNRVLDIGSGTGRAAMGFATRGARVVGIEHDPDMAAVAAASGIEMIVSRFEDYEGAPASFDLVTCAQAWHWIDHDLGQDIAAHVLVPDGILAVWWNRPAHFEGPAWDAVRDVYREFAPDLDRQKHLDDRNYDAPLPPVGALFADWESTVYGWEQTFSAEDYVGMLGTHSDHILLPGETRDVLLTGVATAINKHGGSLTYSWRTLLFTAMKSAE